MQGMRPIDLPSYVFQWTLLAYIIRTFLGTAIWLQQETAKEKEQQLCAADWLLTEKIAPPGRDRACHLPQFWDQGEEKSGDQNNDDGEINIHAWKN